MENVVGEARANDHMTQPVTQSNGAEFGEAVHSQSPRLYLRPSSRHVLPPRSLHRLPYAHEETIPAQKTTAHITLYEGVRRPVLRLGGRRGDGYARYLSSPLDYLSFFLLIHTLRDFFGDLARAWTCEHGVSSSQRLLYVTSNTLDLIHSGTLSLQGRRSGGSYPWSIPVLAESTTGRSPVRRRPTFPLRIDLTLEEIASLCRPSPCRSSSSPDCAAPLPSPVALSVVLQRRHLRPYVRSSAKSRSRALGSALHPELSRLRLLALPAIVFPPLGEGAGGVRLYVGGWERVKRGKRAGDKAMEYETKVQEGRVRMILHLLSAYFGSYRHCSSIRPSAPLSPRDAERLRQLEPIEVILFVSLHRYTRQSAVIAPYAPRSPEAMAISLVLEAMAYNPNILFHIIEAEAYPHLVSLAGVEVVPQWQVGFSRMSGVPSSQNGASPLLPLIAFLEQGIVSLRERGTSALFGYGGYGGL